MTEKSPVPPRVDGRVSNWWARVLFCWAAMLRWLSMCTAEYWTRGSPRTDVRLIGSGDEVEGEAGARRCALLSVKQSLRRALGGAVADLAGEGLAGTSVESGVADTGIVNF